MQNALATDQRIGLPCKIYFLARVCILCLDGISRSPKLHVAPAHAICSDYFSAGGMRIASPRAAGHLYYETICR